MSPFTIAVRQGDRPETTRPVPGRIFFHGQISQCAPTSLQEELLSRLSSDVKVVIAGRHELGRIWTQGSWHALIRPLPLNSLSAGESRRSIF